MSRILPPGKCEREEGIAFSGDERALKTTLRHETRRHTQEIGAT